MIYLIERYCFEIEPLTGKEIRTPYLLKLGYSKHPQRRVRQLELFKGECKLIKTVPGDLAVESLILSRLRLNHRQPGRYVSEWFYQEAKEDAIMLMDKYKKDREHD